MQSLFLLYKEGCEILKKVLCFLLAVSLTFSNCFVAYADLTVDGDGNFVTTTPTPPIPTDYDPVPKGLRFLDELLMRAYKPGITGAADVIQDTWDKYFGKDEEKAKEAIKINGDFMYFNGDFINQLNVSLQDKVHALDGYYLIEPTTNKSFYGSLPDSILAGFNNRTLAKSFSSAYPTIFSDFCYCGIPLNYLLYTNSAGQIRALDSDTDSLVDELPALDTKYGSSKGYEVTTCAPNKYYFSLDLYRKGSVKVFGNPFKLFYSLQDAENYLGNGRTYLPQLPSGGFKINIKYVNNTTNLPDITYNINTTNKTETEIQNQYDTTINNYLNGLDDFTDGGGGTIKPTPTPSGGGSGGDFGDGTTPTPKPDFSDGSLTDTNTLLQKILDKLTEFSANHDKLAKTITDYIEKNDGKLEEILLAIQALSDGKTDTEQNGCKYDFTALSEYLTKLWNNSDKKFDEMVKLLEENNKYQQKLVDSLNEIKALLIADTVMDFFKDRSRETAEKAKDKFPTSIPWDISLVLNSMSAEPKNPKFSLPIKIESFKINETIDIDLSTDEWEKLAKTCRYILSITFILFLIHLSRKLFSSGGDD